jgi:hypothetical protein
LPKKTEGEMPNADESVTVDVEGLREFLAMLNRLPARFDKEIRDAASDIAANLVSGAKGAAHTPLQVLAASALTSTRERTPSVRSGTAMVNNRTRVSDIFYGAEFGGGMRPTTRQFPDYRGKRGYFLYPTARANGPRYWDMWTKAILDAMAQWQGGAT